MSRALLKATLPAALAAGLLFGTAPAQKGGGNSVSKDIPLIATLSDYGPAGNALEITGDGIGPFIHQGTKPKQNKVLFSSGSLVFSIYRESGRWLTLHFDQLLEAPLPVADFDPLYECQAPYFIYPEIWPSITTTYFLIRTTYECQKVSHLEDPLDPWYELIPLDRTYPDFSKMTEGQIKYVCGMGNTIQFRTDDPNTAVDESLDLFALFQEPQFFEIEATDWNGDRIIDWIVRPFAGHLKVRDADTNEYLDLPLGCVPRQVTSSAYRACDHGLFSMPFELKLRRK